MGDKGIVFKNRVGLYEKELQEANEKYTRAIMELNAVDLEVVDLHIKLNNASIIAINEGLTGANQQQRDAQLAVLVEKERTELNDAEKSFGVAKHGVELASSVLAMAKLNIQFISAAMNAGFVIGCTPEPDKASLDAVAKEFSEKFKA
jgi:hypothetical protein